MKFLTSPVQPFFINQPFGTNGACINPKTNEVITHDGNTCPVGFISLYGQMKGHNGLDLQAYHGQEVYASHDGIVCELVSEKDRGLGIGIVTNKLNFCYETGTEEYFKTRYWHNLENLVKLGQEVKKGELIAHADNTGYSSGDHVHFELKPVKIVTVNHKVPVVENLLQYNGYFGAVNPLRYLENAPFRFEFDLKYDGGKQLVSDVKNLQELLIKLKYMSPIPDDEKGYYGLKTKEAVTRFQLERVSLTWYEKKFVVGNKVGEKTRLILNTLI